jgi:hypothetical protein
LAKRIWWGCQTSFAIVSAYIVALYFFGSAPIAMRVLVFVFFSATLAVLGGYLATAAPSLHR